MTTRKPLQDVQRIRALLAPERAARRAQPAPDRPCVVRRIDDRPVRLYRPDDPTAHDPALVVAALRRARETGCVLRLDAVYGGWR